MIIVIIGALIFTAGFISGAMMLDYLTNRIDIGDYDNGRY